MFAKSLVVGALAAFAAAQSSVLSFTSVPNPISVGQAQTISYTTNDTSSPVTILLRKGESTNLQTVSTLTTDSTGGSYSWTPASTLTDGSDYALEITQGSQVNYYGPFTIEGGSGTSSASSSGASSASASMSSTMSANTTTSMTTSMTTAAAVGTVGSASAGTGVPVSRNTTMSSATLSSTSTASGAAYSSARSTTAAATSARSSSASSASASATNGASMQVGSAALAILFGAAAVYFS